LLRSISMLSWSLDYPIVIIVTSLYILSFIHLKRLCLVNVIANMVHFPVSRFLISLSYVPLGLVLFKNHLWNIQGPVSRFNSYFIALLFHQTWLGFERINSWVIHLCDNILLPDLNMTGTFNLRILSITTVGHRLILIHTFKKHHRYCRLL
jgi:hypothetical protein